MGRISRGHDLPGIWQFDQARIMAVCDLDANRVEAGKTLINGYYAKKTAKPTTASPDITTTTTCWRIKILMRW